MSDEVDVTQQIIDAYTGEAPEMPIGERSTNPQAPLMFAKLAANRSMHVHKEGGLNDFNHVVIFEALVTCLTEGIYPGSTISYEEAKKPDHKVREQFQRQLMVELNRHQHACLIHGFWRAYYSKSDDRFHMRLARRRRVSALSGLDPIAHVSALHNALGGNANVAMSIDDAFLRLASGQEHLQYITGADPEGWKRFSAHTGVSASSFAAFSGFLTFLDYAASLVGHSLWYSEAKLDGLWRAFTEAFPATKAVDPGVLDLTDVFSMSPAAAKESGLVVPFLKVGHQYLRYPGYIHSVSLTMGLLSIVIRKHEAEWSRTLGSTLARAADVIAAKLKDYRNLDVVTRRKIGRKGDMDLAIFDKASETLLICEVKTVYDRQRTARWTAWFEDAKVNISRAVAQLRSSIESVQSGQTPLGTIFSKAVRNPKRIRGAVLTWLDPKDLTIGSSEEDILSLNFETFLYLLKVSNGNLETVLKMAHELRNLWFTAIERPLDLGQAELHTDIEVQGGLLDSRPDIDTLHLCDATRAQISHFESLPDTWRTASDRPTRVSYLEESRTYLSTAGAQ